MTSSEQSCTDRLPLVDPAAVRRRLARAGRAPSSACFLHEEVGRRLLEQLDGILIRPKLVMDASAAPGSLVAALRERYVQANLLAVEEACSAVAALRAGERWRLRRRALSVCASATSLPLPDQVAGLVTSNLLLHRYPEPDDVLCAFHRVLADDGLLMLSTVGPDTLAELAQAWKSVDADDHVHAFADMHDLGDALVRAGFHDVVMSSERLTVHYPNLCTLHEDLRALGVSCAAAGRPRTLRTPRHLARVAAAYDELRQPEGLPVSMELVYAHAWRPAARRVSVSFSTPAAPGRQGHC